MTRLQINKMLLAGANAVIESKHIINEINVFPVPDTDTGNNLAKTLTGLIKVLRNDIKTVDTDAISNSLLEASSGNSGIMMTAFLVGFLSIIQQKSEIDKETLNLGFKNGAKNAREAIEYPKVGTILDVMDALTESSKYNLHEKALANLKFKLLETESKMKVLSDNHVVDAGALGFTVFIFGFYGKKFDFDGMNLGEVKKENISFGKFPYEVIFTIAATQFSIDDIKSMLHSLGDCLDIIKVKNKIKVHIHTAEPQLVEQTAQLLGKINTIKTVDMREETAVH